MGGTGRVWCPLKKLVAGLHYLLPPRQRRDLFRGLTPPNLLTVSNRFFLQVQCDYISSSASSLTVTTFLSQIWRILKCFEDNNDHLLSSRPLQNALLEEMGREQKGADLG